MINGTNNPFPCDPVIYSASNTIIAVGTITRNNNIFTFSPGFKWRINGVVYENTTPINITVAVASSGKYRIDNALLNTSNSIELQQGLESDTIAIRPAYPENTILLTSWNVFGEIIDNNIDPIEGSDFIKKTFAYYFNANVSGVEASIPFDVAGRTEIRLTNPALQSIATVNVLDLSGIDTAERPYSGKPYIIRNLTGNTVVVKDSVDIAIIGNQRPRYFPFLLKEDQDLQLPNNEAILFHFVDNAMVEIFRSWSEIDLSQKADLVGGKVPASQLPSYVDDVLEFANFAALPVVGESSKIYVTLNTNKQYRWGGTAYVEISASTAVWGSISGTIANQADLINALADKVDKVTGKGLSTEDYTTTEKNKLAGIQPGAEVNVNADWNAVSGDAQILNKPTIPAAQIQSDWNQSNNTSADFIKNKPTVPSIAGLATESFVNAKIEDAIVDGVTTKAPSQNAVFDALADKENSQNKATTMTGNSSSNTLFLTAKAVYDWAISIFQPLLVSGTNIKTINGNSLLGNGDLNISLGSVVGGTLYSYVAGNGTPTQNATVLQNAYNLAKTITTLTATNRFKIVVGTGKYQFTSQFTIDTQFIDFVSLTGDADVEFTNGINVTTNNVYLKGLKTSLKFELATNLNLLKCENCIGGNESFAVSGGGIVSGTFINCVAGNDSFAASGTSNIASGIFTNCVGGSFCFGGIASGTFTNCVGFEYCYGTQEASGTFTNCIGHDYCFGWLGVLSGKIFYCRLIVGTFTTVSNGGRTYYCINGDGSVDNQ